MGKKESVFDKVLEVAAEQGLKKKHIAECLGIKPAALSGRFNRNTLGVQELYMIADYLKVNITRFFDNDTKEYCPKCGSLIKKSKIKE